MIFPHHFQTDMNMAKRKKIPLKTMEKRRNNEKALIRKKQLLDLPQEIFQLLDAYYKHWSIRKHYPLHHVGAEGFPISWMPRRGSGSVGITKSWMPSRGYCRGVERQWPQLCILDDRRCKRVDPYGSRQLYSVGTSKGDTVDFICHQNGTSYKYECVVVDPFDAKKGYMDLVNAVRVDSTTFYNGKLCAVSLQGSLAVIECDDLRRRTITGISSDRTIPSVRSRFFTQYLFNLDGAVFVVFLIHENSVVVVDQVEVFRLCFDKLKWIKVDRLQGKTFFVGQDRIWVDSAEIGCRGDCVYFSHGSDKRWWLYDMKKCCISPV